MKSSKNLKSFSLVFALALFSVPVALAAEKQSAVVHEVLTGDSVRLTGGKILKYAAIQAPPLQSVILLVRQYGEASLAFNKTLVEGKTIFIEWDSQIRDGHDRLIGYVYLEDGTFVNQEILKAGHAKAVITPPNLRYQGRLRRAEIEARRDRKGLWKEEPENPYIQSQYIGDKNTKIYYFPTSPELDRIPESYLVRFSSRIDAKAAGYRACFDCNEADLYDDPS